MLLEQVARQKAGHIVVGPSGQGESHELQQGGLLLLLIALFLLKVRLFLLFAKLVRLVRGAPMRRIIEHWNVARAIILFLHFFKFLLSPLKISKSRFKQIGKWCWTGCILRQVSGSSLMRWRLVLGLSLLLLLFLFLLLYSFVGLLFDCSSLYCQIKILY